MAKRSAKESAKKKWSAKVTRESRALELEPKVFQKKNAAGIARSLKRSAEKSHARKASPFQSAMSMLSFYINRAGKGLSAGRKATLNEAKEKLRELYHKNAGQHEKARRAS
jgi:hypothetical protein